MEIQDAKERIIMMKGFFNGLVSVSVKKLVPIKKQQRTVSTMRIFFEVINEEIFFPIF